VTDTRTPTMAPTPTGPPQGLGPDEGRAPGAAGPTADRSDSSPADEESEAGTSSGRTIHIPDLPVRNLVGIALIGVGALIVLFIVYLFAFTPLTHTRNQQRLVGSLVGKPLSVYRLVAGHVPAEGSPVGIIEIPKLGLRQVVVEGTSAADLMNGPGLMAGSALPGSPGNSVIAARRVTFGAPFSSLDTLRRNDRIRVVDGAGAFVYRVVHSGVVSSGQRDVVTPTADNRLTLVTSNSTVISSGRLVVVAKLVGKAVDVPGAAVALPTYDLGLSGDPVAGGLTVLWSLLTLALLAGAALIAWRSRRVWLVYLFAAPLVVACGLFACQSLARALPATF
jgi:sortase A